MSRVSIASLVIVTMLWAPSSRGDETHKNYELTLNGETLDLNLDQEIEFEDKEGRKIVLTLKKKRTAEYSDKFVTFLHKSDMSTSSHDLGDGINQIMMNSATGTLVLLQEYTQGLPEGILPLMITELTKEDVSYGYKLRKTPRKRKLKSGHVLKGNKLTLTHEELESYWEIVTFGDGNRGVMVVTQIDKEYLESNQNILDLFWESLEVKF